MYVKNRCYNVCFTGYYHGLKQAEKNQIKRKNC